MDLDQNSNYEWIGTFWFPDNESDKFSGKVTYSPEHGIKLKLMMTREYELIHDFNNHIMSKKLMHATVTGEKPGYVSLFNIRLNRTRYTIGNPTVLERSGGAELLIAGHLFENNVIEKILVAYDGCFNNIFLGPNQRTYDSLRFGDSEPITPKEGCTIGMDMNSWGEPFGSVEELDSFIWAKDKSRMKKLKEVAKPIIEDRDHSFLKRKEVHLAVSFAMKNKGFDSFRKLEFTWRQFWQFIADRHISIKRVWLHIPDQNVKNKWQNRRLSALFSDYGQQFAGKKPPLQHQYHINIKSFGEKASELNLSVIEKTIQEWFRISNDDKFKPVLHGIHRAMQSKNKMVDTPDYVSMIAEIQTFLDLQGETNTKVERLVELHADQDWEDGIMRFATNKSEDETIGQWLRHVRNAVEHPKSYQVESKVKYWEIATDPFQIQKVYAYLSGLYLKAILRSLGNINPTHIDEYTKEYIRIRASYEQINYSD